MTQNQSTTTIDAGDLGDIPEVLRQRVQFVVYKVGQRGDQATKVPSMDGGVGKASTTDSLTWRPFDVARDALRTGRYNGIGFVFSSGDPYAGIDLDKCRNPETVEIEEWATEIIRD